MTARASLLGKIQAWMAERLGKTDAQPPPVTVPTEQPLLKLPRILVGIAKGTGARRHGVQLMVDAMNNRHINGKSSELLGEGESYEVALLLQGVGHVKVKVVVEWVLVGSFHHSVGMRIEHDDESRPAIERFVALLEEGARG